MDFPAHRWSESLFKPPFFSPSKRILFCGSSLMVDADWFSDHGLNDRNKEADRTGKKPLIITKDLDLEVKYC